MRKQRESVFLSESGLQQALNYYKKYTIFFFKDNYTFFRICSIAQVEILTNKLLLVIEKKEENIFSAKCTEIDCNTTKGKWLAIKINGLLF